MAEIDLSSEQFLDLAAEILNQGRNLRFRARGVSMRPFIRDGDLLEIRLLPSQAIRRGDILLYRTTSARSLVHRVTRVRSQGGTRQFLLHGDAVLQADGWVEPGQVLGRVERVEREGERLKVEGKYVSKPAKVIVLDTLPQRLLAVGLATILPLYKRIYHGLNKPRRIKR